MDIENRKRFLLGCTWTGVFVSLLFSAAALYVTWTSKHECRDLEWPMQERRERVRRQDIGSSDDNCVSNRLPLVENPTQNEAAFNNAINRLRCDHARLQQQVDRSVDEFNSVLFFINEIGINMQAAKTEIETNKKLIFLSQISTDRALNKSLASDKLANKVARRLSRLERRSNETKQEQGRLIGELQNQTDSLHLTMAALSLSLENATPRLPAVNSPATGVVVPLDIDLTVSNETALAEIDRRNMENAKKIVNILTSINRLKSKLSNFAADGWYNAPNGHQYFLSKNAFRTDGYARSRRYCNHQGAELAYVGMRNADVYRYLWNTLIAPARHHCVWIGMTDTQTEGDWKWLDGEPLDKHWTNWGPGQPGHRSSTEDCGLIRAGRWNDGRCSGYRKICSFICERRIIQF